MVNNPPDYQIKMLQKKCTLNLIQIEAAVLPQACSASEPSECQHGDTDHREQEAISLPFHETHGAAASGANIVGYRGVGLRFVHGKLEVLPGPKVTRRCSGRDILRRVVHNESVGFGEKRDSASGLVVSSVPHNGLRLLEGLVGRNGVEGVVSRAGSSSDYTCLHAWRYHLHHMRKNQRFYRHPRLFCHRWLVSHDTRVCLPDCQPRSRA